MGRHLELRRRDGNVALEAILRGAGLANSSDQGGTVSFHEVEPSAALLESHRYGRGRTTLTKMATTREGRPLVPRHVGQRAGASAGGGLGSPRSG